MLCICHTVLCHATLDTHIHYVATSRHTEILNDIVPEWDRQVSQHRWMKRLYRRKTIPYFKIWLYFTILRGIFGVKLFFFQERLSQKGLNSCSMRIWFAFKPFQSIFVIADKDDDISIRINQQKQLKMQRSSFMDLCKLNTMIQYVHHCMSVIHFIQILFCL